MKKDHRVYLKHILDKNEERIAPGTILLKAEKLDSVKNHLDRFHVQYSMKKIWSY